MEHGGQPLRWLPGDLPIFVWLDPNLTEAWLDAWAWARQQYNKLVGFELFASGLIPTDAAPMPDPENLPDGAAWIRMGGPDMPKTHAHTMHTYARETGRIKSALVEVPDIDEKETQRGVMVHGLGHVLGLDHDEQRASIMYPVLQQRPQTVTEADIERLRKHYKRG